MSGFSRRSRFCGRWGRGHLRAGPGFSASPLRPPRAPLGGAASGSTEVIVPHKTEPPPGVLLQAPGVGSDCSQPAPARRQTCHVGAKPAGLLRGVFSELLGDSGVGAASEVAWGGKPVAYWSCVAKEECFVLVTLSTGFQTCLESPLKCLSNHT